MASLVYSQFTEGILRGPSNIIFAGLIPYMPLGCRLVQYCSCPDHQGSTFGAFLLITGLTRDMGCFLPTFRTDTLTARPGGEGTTHFPSALTAASLRRSRSISAWHIDSFLCLVTLRWRVIGHPEAT